MTTPTTTSDLLLIARGAEDANYRLRIKAAIFLSATDILSKPKGSDPATEQLRHAAKSAAGAPEPLVWQFAWLTAASPEIRDTIVPDIDGGILVNATDAQVMAACVQAWQLLASTSS